MAHRRNKSDKKKTSVQESMETIKQEIRQLGLPPELRIAQITPPSHEELKVIAELLNKLLSRNIAREAVDSHVIDKQMGELLYLLADLATGVWRARQKMLLPGSDQPQEELRKAFRPLDTTFHRLSQSGVEIIDRTHQPYAVGLGEKVIAFEPASGINRETIIETIKPAIYYQGQLLQQGEIIVGSPISDTGKPSN